MRFFDFADFQIAGVDFVRVLDKGIVGNRRSGAGIKISFATEVGRKAGPCFRWNHVENPQ